MKNLLQAVVLAGSLFCAAAHSQDRVLACEVKTVSGRGATKPVADLKVGDVMNIPNNALVAEGSTYVVRDLFGTESMGESSSMTINRETGQFEFSASYGSFSSLHSSAKQATGVCKAKKMNL